MKFLPIFLVRKWCVCACARTHVLCVYVCAFFVSCYLSDLYYFRDSLYTLPLNMSIDSSLAKYHIGQL